MLLVRGVVEDRFETEEGGMKYLAIIYLFVAVAVSLAWRQMSRLHLLHRCWNLFWYWRWTDCRHVWEPEGHVDWRCWKCGALR